MFKVYCSARPAAVAELAGYPGNSASHNSFQVRAKVESRVIHNIGAGALNSTSKPWQTILDLKEVLDPNPQASYHTEPEAETFFGLGL